MRLMKKILIVAILFLSMNAFADNKKEASKDAPKYELKSDIINFDYSEIGYPTTDVKVGKNFSIDDKLPVPRKVERAKVKPISQGLIIANSIVMAFVLVFAMACSCLLIMAISLGTVVLMCPDKKND